MTITTVTVEISPTLAAHYLTFTATNRKPKQDRVDEYAARMANGLWADTHQGIAFNSVGELIDGRHRLMAIVKSGCTITLPVSTGDIDMLAVDSGTKRSMADSLTITGLPTTSTVAAMSRLVLMHDSGQARPWSHMDAIVHKFSVFPFVESNRELIADAVKRGRYAARFLGGPSAAISAGYFLILRWAQENACSHYADSFIDGLSTGIGLPSGDPRLAYRAWLASMYYKSIQGTSKSHLTMVMLVRCFDLFMLDTPYARISIKDKNTFMFTTRDLHLERYHKDV